MLVMGEAADATTALREVAELQPDLALVDLRLPDTDGIELCHRLKSLPQPPQVLLLTSFGEEDNVMAALGTGADGFILKTSDDDVLVAAITTVASGGTVWPSLAMRRFRENGQRPCKGSANKLHLLTAQERRVLALIAQGQDQQGNRAHARGFREDRPQPGEQPHGKAASRTAHPGRGPISSNSATIPDTQRLPPQPTGGRLKFREIRATRAILHSTTLDRRGASRPAKAVPLGVRSYQRQDRGRSPDLRLFLARTANGTDPAPAG